MLKGLVQADFVAVSAFQFAKNNGGEDGQTAENEVRLVDAVDHFRCARVEPVGNEECRDERGHRDPEAQR